MLIKIIPKKLISSITGSIASIKLPQFILKKIILTFIKKYNVNTNEMLKPIEHYKTINQFFTRKLKKNTRPINQNNNNICSPVDGKISQFGNINKELILQIKNIEYSIYDLIKNTINNEFINGMFITFYLSPKDYHRIHMPCKAKLYAAEYSKGKLYPVNKIGLKIQGLFTLNERLSSFFETNNINKFAMVKVGALNVGSIKTQYKLPWTKKEKKQNKYLFKQIHNKPIFNKGHEIARFELGSTVILLFKPYTISFLKNIQTNTEIKMGQAFATIN